MFLLGPEADPVFPASDLWRAVFVRSPGLTEDLPAKPEGLRTLGRFVRLCRRERPVELS